MIRRLAATLALLLAAPCAALALPEHRDAFTRLTGLEDRAEAIAGGESTGAQAQAAARAIAAGWPALRASFARDPQARFALLAVDGQVAALRAAGTDPMRLRLAANETTGALAPLFDFAGDRVPVGVHLLDYLGRAVAIDASAGAWARAAADAAQLDHAWQSLRPRVLIRPHGEAAAARADAAVARVAAAVAARSTVRAIASARASGDAVDALEKVYGD